MPSPESFTGFPWGAVTFETTEKAVFLEIEEVAHTLTSQPNLLHPPTLAEHYALYTRFSVPQPDGSGVDMTAIVPMDKASYDEFWNFTPPPKKEVSPRDLPTPGPLDLFVPKQPDTEPELDQSPNTYFKDKRLFHDQRMAVIRRVAGKIVTDPEIDRYINSFGTFNNAKGNPTHNQNLGPADIGYTVYTGERPTSDTLLYRQANGGHTQGTELVLRHGHRSPFTGEVASTVTDKQEWDALVRADTQRLSAGIAGVADFYDSIYGEHGLDYKKDRTVLTKGMLLGTIASRDFFEGYIGLAPVGVTLLAADHLKPLDDEYGCGQPYINSPDYWIDNIYPSSQLYFAIRPDLDTSARLVRFGNKYDTTSPETWMKMTAYDQPYDIPEMLKKRRMRGGSYGLRAQDLVDGELPKYTSQMARKQIGYEGLAHLNAGNNLAEKAHAFSHTDFYKIFEQIASYGQ